MKIKTTNPVKKDKLFSEDIDFILCSSGFENRATSFVNNFKDNIKLIKYKFCIGFKDSLVLSRNDNNNFFVQAGFTILEGDGDDANVIKNTLDTLLANCQPNKKVNLLVDYSCMTKIWYAEILNYFNKIALKTEVNIFFIYSYSKFVTAAIDSPNNIHVGPIKGYNSLSLPYKPTALIIGLGYEKNRAYGLTEYLDAETYVFYTDEGTEKAFAKEVELNNSDLLSRIESQNIFRYPLKDLKFTEYLLTSLCNDLKDNYRIILAPCGPKPFSLICLIVSLKFTSENIDVWRISPGNIAEPINKFADGEINIYKVTFA